MAESPGPEQEEWMNAPTGRLLEVEEWARASDHEIAPLVERVIADLAQQLEQAEQAMRLADKDASTAHDAMWAMDMATIMDGPTRAAFEFQRKAASDAIWKIHERLRAPTTPDSATEQGEGNEH